MVYWLGGKRPAACEWMVACRTESWPGAGCLVCYKWARDALYCLGEMIHSKYTRFNSVINERLIWEIVTYTSYLAPYTLSHLFSHFFSLQSTMSSASGVTSLLVRPKSLIYCVSQLAPLATLQPTPHVPRRTHSPPLLPPPPLPPPPPPPPLWARRDLHQRGSETLLCSPFSLTPLGKNIKSGLGQQRPSRPPFAGCPRPPPPPPPPPPTDPLMLYGMPLRPLNSII